MRSETQIYFSVDLPFKFIQFKLKLKNENGGGLTKQISEIYENKNKAKVDTMKWIDDIKSNVKLVRYHLKWHPKEGDF